MKVVALVQARLGSTRLPAKVLQDLAGEPMLARVVNRLRRATTLHEVRIATTTEPADDALVELCEQRGWPYSRGSENDVLDRYLQAARQCQADVIVRITSDCPLIEPALVDELVTSYLRRRPQVCYMANFLPRRTYPRGLDTEVFDQATLQRAWDECRDPAQREHVTLYIYRHPELFPVAGMTHDVDLSHLRWTVDTPEDLALVRRIYEHFGHDHFAWTEVLALLDRHPEWLELNRHVEQKVV